MSSSYPFAFDRVTTHPQRARRPRLSHNPHFVPGDLVVADRQFDAGLAFAGDFACLLPPVDLVRVTGEAAITEIDPVACLELEVDIACRRSSPSDDGVLAVAS